MEKYEELRKLILEGEEDFQKFYAKGNQTAGTRVRKRMQDLKNLAQEIRVDVIEVKNSRATSK